MMNEYFLAPRALGLSGPEATELVSVPQFRM